MKTVSQATAKNGHDEIETWNQFGTFQYITLILILNFLENVDLYKYENVSIVLRQVCIHCVSKSHFFPYPDYFLKFGLFFCTRTLFSVCPHVGLAAERTSRSCTRHLSVSGPVFSVSARIFSVFPYGTFCLDPLPSQYYCFY